MTNLIDGKANPCKSGLTCISCPFLHISKLSFSPFEYPLKIFDAPMFSYNVLWLINFKHFLPFLRRGLSKS